MLTAAQIFAKLKTDGTALEVTTTKQTFAMKFVGTASTGVIINVMTGTPPPGTDAQNHAK